MTKEQANSIIAENEAMVIGCTYNVLSRTTLWPV